jgi:hypothetical protein
VKHPPFQSELIRIERNRWVMGLAALPFLGALALAVLGVFDAPYLLGIPHMMAFGAIMTLYTWRKNFRPALHPCQVSADSAGVAVDGRFIPRSKLRAGFVKPGAHAPRVLLRRTLGLPIELQAGTTDEARALLRALGLDVSQTVADFRIPSRILAKRRYGGIVAAGLAMFAMGLSSMLAAPLGVAMFMAGALTFGVLAAVPSRLRVGADGIEIRWLHTRRFLAYEQISGVVRYEKGWGNSRVIGLRILLRSGEEVMVPVERTNWDSDQVPLIEERIREGKEAVRAGDVAVDAAMLQRGDRSVRDWVAALRAIGSGANVTLRTAPVPRDRLMRIVEDSSQPAPARAAAAVALGSELDEEGRARLRLVAEATVAPKLRISIERAASARDDAEIEAALEEVASAHEASSS